MQIYTYENLRQEQKYNWSVFYSDTVVKDEKNEKRRRIVSK
jgi:hypothetical protein